MLFAVTDEFGWGLRAWAVLSNHYHFVASSPPDPKNLRRMLGKLHMLTAKELNIRDNAPGRKVWFQFRETHLTIETSYLARLKYVHFNPQHHGVVKRATDYHWCSASWFMRSASPAFIKTIESFKIDKLNVDDDF